MGKHNFAVYCIKILNIHLELIEQGFLISWVLINSMYQEKYLHAVFEWRKIHCPLKKGLKNTAATFWGICNDLWSLMKRQCKLFAKESTCSKGNHCILRIRGAPVHQKLGMILENKVVQKLKLEENVFFTKNGLLNWYS